MPKFEKRGGFMEQFYWAALGAAKGIDTARMLVLVRAFGSAQNLYEAEEQVE